MYALGLNQNHDSSAALVRDGEIRYAIAEERLSRVKHDSHGIARCVRYVLEAEGIGPDQLDVVVACRHGRERAGDGDTALMLQLERASGRAIHVHDSHHELHAYSCFYTSPFPSAAVLVADGMGTGAVHLATTGSLENAAYNSGIPLHEYFEAETALVASGTNLDVLSRKLTTHRTYDYDHEDIGIGRLYNYVTREVFEDKFAAGKTMALASYSGANPRIPSFLEFGDDWVRILPERLRAFTGPHLRADPLDYSELAGRVQADLEELLLWRTGRLARQTSERFLCLSGGVALNCTSNTRIAGESGFDDVFIMPAATDDGIAIGAALFGCHNILGQARTPALSGFNPYLGRGYSDDEIAAAWGIRAKDAPRMDLTFASSDQEVSEHTAELLAAGGIVAWFQGGSEFGPRALGNRSLLASPTDPSTRDFINRQVKGRELFRPLAPSVLQECASDYFDVPVGFASPYMLMAVGVRDEWQEQLAAVTHVDESARVQTVGSGNIRFRELLDAFGQVTGLPVLLNTSLNLRGEPIVETPGDALDLFLTAPIDAAVLGRLVLRRRRSV